MYSWGYIKAASLAHLDISEDEARTRNMLDRFPFYANEAITQICSAVKPKRSFATFVISKEQENVGTLLTMPNDFISFGDDVNIVVVKDELGNACSRETCDEDFLYKGINKLIFFTEGTYYISYNARWITFSAETNEFDELDVPADILDCLPLFIASRCYGVDDEYKSSKYRNEYEMSLARIDDTDYKQTKTFKISGGW